MATLTTNDTSLNEGQIFNATITGLTTAPVSALISSASVSKTITSLSFTSASSNVSFVAPILPDGQSYTVTYTLSTADGGGTVVTGAVTSTNTFPFSYTPGVVDSNSILQNKNLGSLPVELKIAIDADPGLITVDWIKMNTDQTWGGDISFYSTPVTGVSGYTTVTIDVLFPSGLVGSFISSISVGSGSVTVFGRQTQLFSNNASGLLSASIAPNDRALTLLSGEGALFPNPIAGEYFLATIQLNGQIEIVKCTSVSGDTFTIERGQEGTSPSSFQAGASVQIRTTASLLNRVANESTAFKGTWDISSNTLPFSPTIGDMWKIANSGTINGTTYYDGDFIVFDGKNFFTPSLNFDPATKLDVGATAANSLLLGGIPDTGFWKTTDFNITDYLPVTTAASTYETQANAAATYETQANAAATYETQANAAATYETQANAAATYLPIGVSAAYAASPGVAVTANTALTAADIGKWFEIQTSGVALTLPLSSSVPAGSIITVRVLAATCAVSAASGDTLSDVRGQAIASESFYYGQAITFVSSNNATWAVVSQNSGLWPYGPRTVWSGSATNVPMSSILTNYQGAGFYIVYASSNSMIGTIYLPDGTSPTQATSSIAETTATVIDFTAHNFYFYAISFSTSTTALTINAIAKI